MLRVELLNVHPERRHLALPWRFFELVRSCVTDIAAIDRRFSLAVLCDGFPSFSPDVAVSQQFHSYSQNFRVRSCSCAMR